MSEETTGNLNESNSFESRVLAELAAINSRLSGVENRLTALEDKVDARLHDTRPMWEAVLQRLDLIDSKLDVLGLDVLEMRGEVNLLKQQQQPRPREVR